MTSLQEEKATVVAKEVMEVEDIEMTVPTVQIAEKRAEHRDTRHTRRQKIAATTLIVIRTHANFGTLKLNKKFKISSSEKMID